MAIYTRTTTIDSGPTGDSVKQAVLDLDTDLTGIVAAYDVHDVATTSVHGFTGTKTGTGAMVGATAPTLVTPVLGVATATSINKVAITAPATSSTLTVADGKTLTASATMTLTGTDSTQLSLAGNLTTAGAYATTITTTNTTAVTLPTSGTLVSSVTTGNGVSASNTAGALAFTLGAITPSTVNGITLTGGTNTFSAAVGTASLDVAAAATVNIDKSLTVNGNYGTVLASNTQENTVTLAGNLTVESASLVNQDLTTDASPTFAAIKITTGAGANKVLTSDADGDATWETAAAAISDTAYDATSWDGVTTVGASKNALRDKIELMTALFPTALGTANTHQMINAGGTAAEWAVPYKIGTFTRDIQGADATVAYAGVGFKPAIVLFLASDPDAGGTNSIGFDDGTLHYAKYGWYGQAGLEKMTATKSIHCQNSGGSQTGYVSTLGSDGFSITWDYADSPNAGTVTVYYLALR